jgi:hypothetical protein
VIWWLKKVLPYRAGLKPARFFLFLGFLIFGITGNAHTHTADPDEHFVEQYHALIRLASSDWKDLQLPTKTPVSDPFRLWLKHSQATLKVIFLEETSFFSELESFHKQSKTVLKKSKEEEVWRSFLEAEMDLQLAFARLKMGKEWSAGWQIRSAFLQLKEINASYPDFLPAYKSLGVLEVILGLAPSSYQWLLSILGMQADVEQGLKDLEMALRDPLVGEEAHYWLGVLNALFFDEVAKGLLVIEPLPESKMKRYVSHHLLMKNAEAAEAIQVMEGEDLSFYPPQIYHSMGMAYLQGANWDSAQSYFLQFLNGCDCRHLVKNTFFRLHQIALFKNNVAQAEVYRKLAETGGWKVAEADQLVQRELEEDIHPFLVQARLSTDGGYATEAADWLEKAHAVRSENLAWEAEWRYRSARLEHLKGNHRLALEGYLSTLELSADDGRYIFANAALKAAELAAKKGSHQLSRKLYYQAMEFKNHAYVASVESKARYGLSQLGE